MEKNPVIHLLSQPSLFRRLLVHQLRPLLLLLPPDHFEECNSEDSSPTMIAIRAGVNAEFVLRDAAFQNGAIAIVETRIVVMAGCARIGAGEKDANLDKRFVLPSLET